jgi:hypothetical protein
MRGKSAPCLMIMFLVPGANNETEPVGIGRLIAWLESLHVTGVWEG